MQTVVLITINLFSQDSFFLFGYRKCKFILTFNKKTFNAEKVKIDKIQRIIPEEN